MTHDEHPRKLKRADFEFRWERAAYPVALAIGIMSAYCEARASTVGLHLHTFHLGGDGDLPPALRNTDHTPGLYVRSESGLTAGIARNSFRRTSVYLAQTWTTDDERFSVSVGAITGYRYKTVTGQRACPEGRTHAVNYYCEWNYGKTSAHLRPLLAPSWAWIEARPYLGGATPRVVLLGKGVNVSIEARF